MSGQAARADREAWRESVETTAPGPTNNMKEVNPDMSSVAQPNTAHSSDQGTSSFLLRAMVGTQLAAQSLGDRVSNFRERMGMSPVAWFVVVLLVGVVVVAALFAFCVSQGYSGISGYYKISENWYEMRFRVGCV